MSRVVRIIGGGILLVGVTALLTRPPGGGDSQAVARGWDAREPAADGESESESQGDAAPGETDAAGARHWMRRATSWAIYAAVVAVIVVSAPRVLAAVLGTEYPMAAVTSGSMWPTLHKGDMVILRGVDSPSDIQVGDIVGFRQADGGFAIHRIVKIDGEQVTTKGDANTHEDPAIDFTDIVGKVTGVGGKMLKLPYLGYLGMALHGAAPNTLNTQEAQAASASPPGS